MAFNLIKIYNQHLELLHYNQYERTLLLKTIFNRDIVNNLKFLFQEKIIRPIKRDGEADMDTLFAHLTEKSEEIIDDNGKKIKKRGIFDIERSKRLHWIWHHIQEKKKDLKIFSYTERKNGKDVLRTYIFDEDEDYVIVLEPQRSMTDYYLLSAYYLNEDWAKKNMRKKWAKRLPKVY